MALLEKRVDSVIPKWSYFHKARNYKTSAYKIRKNTHSSFLVLVHLTSNINNVPFLTDGNSHGTSITILKNLWLFLYCSALCLTAFCSNSPTAYASFKYDFVHCFEFTISRTTSHIVKTHYVVCHG